MKMNIRGLSYNDAKSRIAEIDSMDDVEFNDLINHWKINDIPEDSFIILETILFLQRKLRFLMNLSEHAVMLAVGDVFMDVVHEYPDLTVHLTLFNATIAGGEPQKLEHNDIQWITPSEILILIFSIVSFQEKMNQAQELLIYMKYVVKQKNQ